MSDQMIKASKGARNMQGRSRDGAGIPALRASVTLPSNYQTVLTEIKSRIQSERIRVVLSANSAMVLLYWDIGNGILEQQKQQGWGAKVIDRLSFDLKNSFPDMSGLSPRNLKYMRKFAESWTDRAIVQRSVAQIPWRSNLALLDKLNSFESRIWYGLRTIENGWSRNVLVMQKKQLKRLRLNFQRSWRKSYEFIE